MEKKIKKFKGNIGLLITIIAIFLFVGLILIKIIDVLFDIPGTALTQINNIYPDNVLIYIGGLISSIASIFLGFIVYQQNKRTNNVNERLSKLEEEEYLPFVGIDDFCGRKGDALIIAALDGYESSSIIHIIDMAQQEAFNVVTTNLSSISSGEDYNIRLYDIHFRYSGKTRCKKIIFQKILFYSKDNTLTVNATPNNINCLNIALSNDSKATIQLAMIYNDSYNIKNIYDGKIVIELILKTVNNIFHPMKITIKKHFTGGTRIIENIEFSDIEIATDIDYD